MKNKIRIMVPLLLLVVVGLALCFWLFRRHAPAGTLTVSGNIEVIDSRLSFRIPGRLIERLVDEGVFVDKGQLIARLDRTDQELAVKRAEANAAYAQAVLDEMDAGTRPEDIERAKAMMEQARAVLREMQHGSRPQEIEESKAELERARAAVAGARSQFEVAEADYERYRDLYARRVVSTREYDDIRKRFETAKSGF